MGTSYTLSHILKYNQRDATLHNLFISVKRSTCFRRFVHLSSGTQKLYVQHQVLFQTFTATCRCHGRDGTPWFPSIPRDVDPSPPSNAVVMNG